MGKKINVFENEKYKKGVRARIEFGDYDNYAWLTPVRIVSSDPYLVIEFKYDDGRTIELCPDPGEIDLSSFEEQ